MPRKPKEQSKPTPARGEQSSDVEDLRSNILEELGEIDCDIRWVQDRIERDPKLPSGENVNHRITRARGKTKTLIYEYATGLAAIFPNDHVAVQSEAEVLWPIDPFIWCVRCGVRLIAGNNSRHARSNWNRR